MAGGSIIFNLWEWVVARRQRDYRAEYAARKQRAKDAGFTGYSQKRRILRERVKAKAARSKLAERIADRLIERTPIWERMEEPLFQSVDELKAWWEMYRDLYDGMLNVN